MSGIPCECSACKGAEVLTPAEIGALLALIITINAWNAIGVTTRAWTPGSYQP